MLSQYKFDLAMLEEVPKALLRKIGIDRKIGRARLENS